MRVLLGIAEFFFFNDTATTEIYTLSLHDALPIYRGRRDGTRRGGRRARAAVGWNGDGHRDRKSTRLNSSHSQISYAVFCLKKKTIKPQVLREADKDKNHADLPAIRQLAVQNLPSH